MSATDSIRHTLRVVVEMLVRQEYVQLEQVTGGTRLRASEIEAGVLDYGKTIVDPPVEAFSNADIVQIRGTMPPAYSVRFRLYTREEGLSDLELQATFIEVPLGERMKVEIDNIVVA